MLDFFEWILILIIFLFGYTYLRTYLSGLMEKYASKFGDKYLSVIKYDGLRKWIAIFILILLIWGGAAIIVYLLGILV